MAHGITNTDEMFSVRQTPWHGLGKILPELATAQEALEAANLSWQVQKVPVFAHFPDGSVSSTRNYATVREDTKEVLGVVGTDYTPLQNADAFKFFDAVCQDPNGPKYETAGSLHGGRKVWILAKMPSFIEVIGHDIIKEYLLLSNTHDGSKQLEMRWTTVRVVCQNTLSLASRGVAEVRLRHRSDLTRRISDVQELLGITKANHEFLTEATAFMLTVKPTEEQITDVLTKLLGNGSEGPEGESETSPQKKRVKGEIETLYNSSETCNLPGMEGTAWGLLNAITEWSDHNRPYRSAVTDLESAQVDSLWFGRGDTFKRKAFDLVTSLK